MVNSAVRVGDFQDFKFGYTIVDDMILAAEQYEVLYQSNPKSDQSKAVKRWPSSTIPYLIDENFSIVSS
jgi:hypothetical protein